MGVRHSGQPLSIATTASAQLSQNREWPHDTRATPVCEAIKRTSQQSVDCGDCATQLCLHCVGSTCLAGWRRHVLLWVLLLCSVVVVADIGSDVERLGVRAEAMADRTEELQFTVRSSVVSFDARLDADIVLDIAFFSGGVCWFCFRVVQFIRCYLVTGLLRIAAVI